MAVRVGDTLKPMNNQDFPVVEATDVSGLATVATSGSYNDLTDKPSIIPAGSESLPVYINSDSEPTPITSLTIAGYVVELIWLHTDDTTLIISSTGLEFKDFQQPCDNNLSFYVQDGQTGDSISGNYISGAWTIISASGAFEDATVTGDYTDFTVLFDNTTITESSQVYLELGINVEQYSDVSISKTNITVNGLGVSVSGHTHDYNELDNKPYAGSISLPTFVVNGRHIPIDHLRLTGSNYDNYQDLTSSQMTFSDDSITIDVSAISPRIKQTDCIKVVLYMSNPWGTFEFYCKYGESWIEQYYGNVTSASIQIVYDDNYEYVNQFIIDYSYSERSYTSFSDVSTAFCSAGPTQYMQVTSNYISKYQNDNWIDVSWEGHTHSKSSITDWPSSVGSTSLPVYFDSNGAAQTISSLSIGNVKANSTTGLLLESNNENTSLLIRNDVVRFTGAGYDVDLYGIANNGINLYADVDGTDYFSIRTANNSSIYMSDQDGITLGNDGGGKVTIEDCPLQIDISAHVGAINSYDSGVTLLESDGEGIIKCDVVRANEDIQGIRIQTKEWESGSENAELYLSDDEQCTLRTNTGLVIDSTIGISTSSSWSFDQGTTSKVSISPSSTTPLSVVGSINAQGINIGNSSNATYGGSFSNNGILTVGYTNNYGIINVKNNSNSNAIVLNGNNGLITCSSLTLDSQDVSTYVLKNLYTKGSTGSLYMLRLTRSSTNSWSTPCTLEYTTHESSTNWWIRLNSGTGSWYLISGVVECDPTGTITGNAPSTTLKFMSVTPLKFSTSATTCVGLFVCM